MSEEHKAIAARRREIAADKADHLTAIETLDAESAELDVAERVINRLVLKGAVISPPAHSRAAVLSPAIDAAAGTGRKPPNTPTVPEMILELLGERAQHGMGGLDSKGLTQLIGEKWWPGVTATEINPIAWRMAKREQVVKDGPVYRLRRNPVTDPSPPDGDEPIEGET